MSWKPHISEVDELTKKLINFSVEEHVINLSV